MAWLQEALESLIAVPVCTWLLVALVAACFAWLFGGRKSGHPPGPRGLPVLGYLPFLTDDLHLDFMKIQKDYGRVFSLKIGMRNVVVLSDFSAIKEAFNKEEISDKPPELYRFSENVRHLSDQKDWKDWRRLSLSSLRSMGMGKNKLQAEIEEQVQGVLERLSKSSGDVDLHELLYPAINSIIISMICGKKLKDDPSFSKIVDDFSGSALEFCKKNALTFYLPFLKPLAPYLISKEWPPKRTMDLLEKLMWKEISSHEKELGDNAPEDFIDHYLKEVEKTKGENPSMNDRNLNGNCQLLLLAGNETALSTIEWALLHMAQRQDVQERAYQEIVNVAGRERPPSWLDKDKMPYLDAILTESSRLNTVVPYGIPHWNTRDTRVGRFVIPKDTIVISNLHAVHMDADLWNKPGEFNPERFLTPEGHRIKDPEYLIPFGIGKRSCVGERLALEEVFVLVSAILQHFKILPPSGGVRMEAKSRITLIPVYPNVRVQKRN